MDAAALTFETWEGLQAIVWVAPEVARAGIWLKTHEIGHPTAQEPRRRRHRSRPTRSRSELGPMTAAEGRRGRFGALEPEAEGADPHFSPTRNPDDPYKLT